jgi:hypothetical protein
MEHVTKQHRVETLIAHGKMPAIVRQILNVRGRAVADVDPDHGFADEAAQMMRDETVAAADVEHVGPRRQYTRYFERHIVRSPNLAPSSRALEAALDCGEYIGHAPRICNDGASAIFLKKANARSRRVQRMADT